MLKKLSGGEHYYEISGSRAGNLNGRARTALLLDLLTCAVIDQGATAVADPGNDKYVIIVALLFVRLI